MQPLSRSNVHCLADVTTGSLLPYVKCIMLVANRSSAAKRIRQADTQTSRRKGFSAQMNLYIPKWLLWMTTTNRFPLTTWLVKVNVSCWPLKFTFVGCLYLWCRAKILVNQYNKTNLILISLPYFLKTYSKWNTFGF